MFAAMHFPIKHITIHFNALFVGRNIQVNTGKNCGVLYIMTDPCWQLYDDKDLEVTHAEIEPTNWKSVNVSCL